MHGPDLFEIISEDADLLVINKPAGLVCHPTKTDEYSSLIGRVRLYLGPAIHPHLVNRLDRETSGVTMVAKTDEAARDLRRLWENRQVQKEYLAIVHGQLPEAHGIIEARLGKDERSRVVIKDCVRSDGAAASTEYWVVKEIPGGFKSRGESSEQEQEQDQEQERKCFTLLRVQPHTGRKHQIRIHLSHIGHPIVGDKLYGEDEDLYLALVENRLTEEQWKRLIIPYHALHASEVRFVWRGEQKSFSAKPDNRFRGLSLFPMDE
jgi:23S rRNA pseudouridine1911/1915/1917 synthase